MKLKAIFIHLGAWGLLLIYFYTAWLGKDPDSKTLWFNASMIIARVGQFYFCYLLIYPLFLRKGKTWVLLLGILLAYLLFLLLRSSLEEVIYPLWLGFDNYYDGTSVGFYMVDNIYYGVPFIFFSAAIYFVQEAFTKKKQNDLLKREARQAELSFLKNQINPHFLYNSLNYIYSLAIPVSEQLSDAVLKLSDMMRYTLKEHPGGLVPIAQEWQYIQDYVSFFRMRFEPGFYVELQAHGTKEQRIPALLLIPFVENAFKHGATDNPKHPIRIHLEVNSKRLTFTVSNKVSNKQRDHSSGIGLANVKRRLQLIYPDRHELLVAGNGRTYKVTLIIQLNEIVS